MSFDFKAMLDKLGPLKNKAILTPLAITLVALILLVPTQLMSGRLKAKVESDSVRMGSRLRSIQPVPREQWQVEQQYQDLFAQDANQAELLALQSTQRELLSYRIFPDPCSSSQMIFQNFADAYRGGIEQMMVKVTAKTSPAETELEAALEKASPTNRRRTPRYRSSPATSRPGRGITARFGFGRLDDTEKTIVDLLCQEKAKTGKVYAVASDIAGYDFWETFQYVGAEDAVQRAWHHQMAYWVIEDLFTTIDQMNADSTDIIGAPVKRLMRVDFIPNARRDRRGRPVARSTRINARGKSANNLGNVPNYVKTITDGLTQPCTGRFCNEDNDVVHFNFSVIISADSIVSFTKALCGGKPHRFTGWNGRMTPATYHHNQITVLESATKAIDRESDDHLLFRYGQNPVVELDLICEYLFNRAAYDPVIPQTIKDERDKQEETSGRRGRR